MARKPNYDFEKRRKEADRKAKKDARRENRERRKAEGGVDEFGNDIPIEGEVAVDEDGEEPKSE